MDILFTIFFFLVGIGIILGIGWWLFRELPLIIGVPLGIVMLFLAVVWIGSGIPGAIGTRLAHGLATTTQQLVLVPTQTPPGQTGGATGQPAPTQQPGTQAQQNGSPLQNVAVEGPIRSLPTPIPAMTCSTDVNAIGSLFGVNAQRLERIPANQPTVRWKYNRSRSGPAVKFTVPPGWTVDTDGQGTNVPAGTQLEGVEFTFNCNPV